MDTTIYSQASGCPVGGHDTTLTGMGMSGRGTRQYSQAWGCPVGDTTIHSQAWGCPVGDTTIHSQAWGCPVGGHDNTLTGMGMSGPGTRHYTHRHGDVRSGT